MTPDPKLVEALRMYAPGRPEHEARAFLTEHRLVQLPEEPNATAGEQDWERDPFGVWNTVGFPSPAVLLGQTFHGVEIPEGTPVYIIPSEATDD